MKFKCTVRLSLTLSALWPIIFEAVEASNHQQPVGTYTTITSKAQDYQALISSRGPHDLHGAPVNYLREGRHRDPSSLVRPGHARLTEGGKEYSTSATGVLGASCQHQELAGNKKPTINEARPRKRRTPRPAALDKDKGGKLIDGDLYGPRLMFSRTGASQNGPHRSETLEVSSSDKTTRPHEESSAGSGSSRRTRAINEDGDLSQGANNSNENVTITTSGGSSTLHSDESTRTIDTKSLKCRVEKNFYLDYEEYKHYSCANCYNHMPKKIFWTKLFYKKEARIWLFDEISGQSILPNETDIIRATFKEESSFLRWRECCAKAIECCVENSIYLPNTTDHNGKLIDQGKRGVCPATWDGFSCWQDTPAGTVAQHICPSNVYFLSFMPVCRGTVTKQCFPNGSWYIRNDHEWSNYTNCAPLPIYATRMLVGSIWHIISAIVIGPALIILRKFPNRSGSKRVRILGNLLFWLLLSGSLSAVHKIGVIGGIFLPGAEYDQPKPPPPIASILANLSRSSLGGSSIALGDGHTSAFTTANPLSVTRLERSTSAHRAQLQASSSRKLDTAKLHYGKFDNSTLPYGCDDASDDCVEGYNFANKSDDGPIGLSSSSLSPPPQPLTKEFRRGVRDSSREGGANGLPAAGVGYTGGVDGYRVADNDKRIALMEDKYDARSLNSNKKPLNRSCSSASTVESQQTSVQADDKLPRLVMANRQPSIPTSCGGLRFRRSTSDQAKTASQSAIVAFICWLVSLAVRITRLLCYSWMFTGAVYLCSILHYAPAEPPSSFVRWLMISTDGFPIALGFVYLIARTIYEPSPLTLIIKLPYYYLMNETAQVEELWATQLNCWMFRSKYDIIEDIADFPNLVLVILNCILFVVTLIIMCRISRPGCTRHSMSLGDYFKAAGTLVVLYGGHYILFVYQPNVEGCIKGQIMYYASLFVDGIQGIAVSYVFCYKTNEGKEIMRKWVASCQDRRPRWCQLSNSSKLQTNRDYENNKSSTHSSRSNNSACYGRDVTTELIDVDENTIAMHI